MATLDSSLDESTTSTEVFYPSWLKLFGIWNTAYVGLCLVVGIATCTWASWKYPDLKRTWWEDGMVIAVFCLPGFIASTLSTLITSLALAPFAIVVSKTEIRELGFRHTKVIEWTEINEARRYGFEFGCIRIMAPDKPSVWLPRFLRRQ